MADASTIATVAYIYKHRYSDRQATEIALREHPTFYQMPKEGAFDGADFNYAITTGNPQGVSALFANAQANAESLKGGQLAAVPVTKYAVCTLDGPSMMRARGNKASFYDLVTRTQDGALDELGANIAYDLHRDNTGLRGQRASIVGNVIQLTQKRDVEHFKRGMSIMASPNADGSAPRVGKCKVTALNRGLGKITVDNAGAIAAFADNDFIFRDGDAGACMFGFEKSTPLVAPNGGENFRGIDRTLDLEAFAGSRIDDPNRYPEEVLGDIAVECQIVSKKLTQAAVFPTTFQSMVKRLGAKVEYMPGETADVGFEYITISTAGGVLQVYADPDARYDRVRGYRPDAHCIKHLDELVHIIRDDGRPSLRDTSSDGIEIRCRSLHDYVQYDTGSHGVASTNSF